MFAEITKSIYSFGTFSEEEVGLFLGALKVTKVPRGEKVLRKGEVCQEISYVRSGSFFQSSLNDELDLDVFNLFVANDWMLNHSSFTSQNPSNHDIEAFEDSEVLTLNIHDVHELIGKHPSFFALGKILEVDTTYSDPKKSPDDKYRELLARKPEVVKTFPLKYIASYLGMTPETLSRVRSRIK